MEVRRSQADKAELGKQRRDEGSSGALQVIGIPPPLEADTHKIDDNKEVKKDGKEEEELYYIGRSRFEERKDSRPASLKGLGMGQIDPLVEPPSQGTPAR